MRIRIGSNPNLQQSMSHGAVPIRESNKGKPQQWKRGRGMRGKFPQKTRAPQKKRRLDFNPLMTLDDALLPLSNLVQQDVRKLAIKLGPHREDKVCIATLVIDRLFNPRWRHLRIFVDILSTDHVDRNTPFGKLIPIRHHDNEAHAMGIRREVAIRFKDRLRRRILHVAGDTIRQCAPEMPKDHYTLYYYQHLLNP